MIFKPPCLPHPRQQLRGCCFAMNVTTKCENVSKAEEQLRRGSMLQRRQLRATISVYLSRQSVGPSRKIKQRPVLLLSQLNFRRAIVSQWIVRNDFQPAFNVRPQV